MLARPPSKIILGDVIRYIDGPIEPIGCVEKGYSGCSDLYKCAFRSIWRDVTKVTSGVIDRVTFEDLANRVKSRKGSIAYQI